MKATVKKNIHKILLVVWFLCLLFWPKTSNRYSDSKNSFSKENLYKQVLTKANFGMLGVEFFQSKEGLPHWKVHSNFAELYRSEHYAFMKEVKANFFSRPSGNVIVTVSDYGRSRTDKSYIELEDNVEIQSSNGYLFTTSRLNYDGLEHYFFTEEFVSMKGPDSKTPKIFLQGTGMKAFIDNEHFIIKKNVFSKKRIKDSDWMYVNSVRGEFFTSQNRALYQGNVKARMPELTILGQRLEIKFNEKEGDSFFVQDKVEMYHKNRHAKSERAIIERSTNKILLEGNASVDSKGNIISGKKITLYMDEDKIEVEDAEGRVQNETSRQ